MGRSCLAAALQLHTAAHRLSCIAPGIAENPNGNPCDGILGITRKMDQARALQACPGSDPGRSRARLAQ